MVNSKSMNFTFRNFLLPRVNLPNRFFSLIMFPFLLFILSIVKIDFFVPYKVSILTSIIKKQVKAKFGRIGFRFSQLLKNVTFPFQIGTFFPMQCWYQVSISHFKSSFLWNFDVQLFCTVCVSIFFQKELCEKDVS